MVFSFVHQAYWRRAFRGVTMDQLPHNGPEKAECEGDREKCSRDDCPIFGKPLKPNKDGKRRIRGCGDKVAKGTRARRSGKRAQRKVANALNIPTGIDGGNEETWRSSLRIEVKSGAQVRPAVTAYLKQKAQSEEARPIGDNRPFVGVAVYENVQVMMFEIDQLRNVIAALQDDLQ